MTEPVIAVFDLDGTLTADGSLETHFARFAWQQGLLHLPSLLFHAAHLISKAPFDSIEAIKRNKKYLRGMTVQAIQDASREFIRCEGHRLLAPYALPLLQAHRSMGHINILITGSLDVLVLQLVRQFCLPLDHIFATKLAQENGKLTGRIDGPHYYGHDKTVLIKHWARERGIDLTCSFCYADSFSDITLMQMFGNPVAVRPDKSLAATADARNWHILQEDRYVTIHNK
ncbi:MAG TPA: HAD family phosphatase [Deltaproteobacteria bacterium]|mgnify:CR=1 FL=1|nr:HAD family phosphatase [Deltaproteobacteria bacterium]HQB39464.1 HAD family phosphatase [Deltaproteobacteria bacterium]